VIQCPNFASYSFIAHGLQINSGTKECESKYVLLMNAHNYAIVTCDCLYTDYELQGQKEGMFKVHRTELCNMKLLFNRQERTMNIFILLLSVKCGLLLSFTNIITYCS
jgi:hypothetical protein